MKSITQFKNELINALAFLMLLWNVEQFMYQLNKVENFVQLIDCLKENYIQTLINASECNNLNDEQLLQLEVFIILINNMKVNQFIFKDDYIMLLYLSKENKKINDIIKKHCKPNYYNIDEQGQRSLIYNFERNFKLFQKYFSEC